MPANTTREFIQKLRSDFSLNVLDEKKVSSSPFIQFDRWMKEAIDAKVIEPNAMTLATSAKGKPDARVLLLRDYSSKGFTFFTNYNSIKGKEIRHNKNVCLNFFWPELQRQVRIIGTVEYLSGKASDKYFESRPRESKIAAWTSFQSEPLTNRKKLDEKYEFYEKKFSGKNVPRPEHWGGYIVSAHYFEFWQGRSNRLHDRIIYEKMKNKKWQIVRLNP